MRLETGDVAPAEVDRAGVGHLDAGDQIDEGGLAGAVRPDQPAHLTGVDAHADAVVGDEPAVPLDEALCHQHAVAVRSHASRPFSPNSPFGRTSSTRMTSKKP